MPYPVANFLALAMSIASLVLGLIALRQARRLAHRVEQHERAVAILAGARRPPPDGGGRHLRLVAVWLPLVGVAGWVARTWRAHPVPVSLAAMTTSLAAIVAIGVLAPSPAGTPAAKEPPRGVAPTGPTTISAVPTVHRRRRPPMHTGSRAAPGLPPGALPTPSSVPMPTTPGPTSVPVPSTSGPPTSTTTTGPPTSTAPAPPCHVVCLSIGVHLPILDDLPDAPSLRDLLGVD